MVAVFSWAHARWVGGGMDMNSDCFRHTPPFIPCISPYALISTFRTAHPTQYARRLCISPSRPHHHQQQLATRVHQMDLPSAPLHQHCTHVDSSNCCLVVRRLTTQLYVGDEVWLRPQSSTIVLSYKTAAQLYSLGLLLDLTPTTYFSNNFNTGVD